MVWCNQRKAVVPPCEKARIDLTQCCRQLGSFKRCVKSREVLTKIFDLFKTISFGHPRGYYRSSKIFFIKTQQGFRVLPQNVLQDQKCFKLVQHLLAQHFTAMQCKPKVFGLKHSISIGGITGSFGVV